MKRLKHILQKRRSGQAAVEMALVLPILLMLICGMIDFGWIIGNKLLVSYCSREGARYGIVVASEADNVNLITQRVLNVAPSYLRNGLTVNVTFTDPDDPQEGDVSVDVSYTANVLTPVGQIFTQSQTIAVSSDCVMKAE